MLSASFEENNGIYECVGENLVKRVTKQLTVEIKGEDLFYINFLTAKN